MGMQNHSSKEKALVLVLIFSVVLLLSLLVYCFIPKPAFSPADFPSTNWSCVEADLHFKVDKKGYASGMIKEDNKPFDVGNRKNTILFFTYDDEGCTEIVLSGGTILNKNKTAFTVSVSTDHIFEHKYKKLTFEITE